MKLARDFVTNTVVGGVLVLLPIYLTLWLLLKGMHAVGDMVHPVAQLLPESVPAENLLSLLVLLLICFLVGTLVRTRPGHDFLDRMESGYLGRVPGYELFRSLTQQIAGKGDQNAWQPALVEIEEALVPAFIVEAHDDGQFTVFVPSSPTPFAGAVYVLTPERVHIVDISFAKAVRAISRWGTGSKEMVAAMRKAKPAASA